MASCAEALACPRRSDIDTERIRELNFGKRQKTEGSAKGGWESGVGYGHTGTEGGALWDVAATEKAQAQQDVEMRKLLAHVTAAAERGVSLGDREPEPPRLPGPDRM